jgi:L-alanine-DL-glutamate epimerase-like enolase superfamily enzyme
VPPDRGTADRDMKIATIDVIVVGIPFAGGSKSAESAWRKKNASRADSLLVKVTTEGGIIGWGEAFGFTAIPAVKAAIEEVISRKSCTDWIAAARLPTMNRFGLPAKTRATA